jgi:hypothetical protein
MPRVLVEVSGNGPGTDSTGMCAHRRDVPSTTDEGGRCGGALIASGDNAAMFERRFSSKACGPSAWIGALTRAPIALVSNRARVHGRGLITFCPTKRVRNASAVPLVLTVDALGVGAEQHLYAAVGPLGDLGCGDTCVQPGRDAGVPKIVRSLPDRGVELGFRQGDFARPGPDRRERAVSDVACAGPKPGRRV